MKRLFLIVVAMVMFTSISSITFSENSKYDEVILRADGYSQVMRDGKWGAINPEGEIIVSIIYDEVIPVKYDTGIRRFYGYSQVMRDGKWGLINHEGKIIVPILYDDVMYGDYGRFIVETGDKFGAVSYEGEIIVPLIYDFVSYFDENVAIIIKDGKYGYVRSDGEVIVPIIYDGAKYPDVKTGKLLVKKGNNWVVYQSKQEKDINIVLDEEILVFDEQPFIQNDRVYVPMRRFFEQIGATVQWYQESKTAVATMGTIQMMFPIGGYARINSTEDYDFNHAEYHDLNHQFKLINDKIFIPVRYVRYLLLDVKIDWDEETKTVCIKTSSL